MAVTAEDITKLYQEYLGREPLQSGIDAWLATGQSLVEIAAGISQSPEANVYRTYQQTLGREPEIEERQAWVEQINETGSIQQAVDSIATSPEAMDYERDQTDLLSDTTEVDTTIEDTIDSSVDASERLYDYTNQREEGGSQNLYWGNYSRQVTTGELEELYNLPDNTRIREAFGTFDNYMAYMDERQDLIESGDYKSDWWDTGVALVDAEGLGREGGQDDRALEMDIMQEGARQGEAGYNEQKDVFESLYEKYTGESVVKFLDNGAKYEWNGTSFVLTQEAYGMHFGSVVGTVLPALVISAGLGPAGANVFGSGFGAGASRGAISSMLGQYVTSGKVDPKSVAQSAALGGVGGFFDDVVNATPGVSGGWVVDGTVVGAPGQFAIEKIQYLSQTLGIPFNEAAGIVEGILTGAINGQDLEGIAINAVAGWGDAKASNYIKEILGADGVDVDNFFREGSTNISTESIQGLVSNGIQALVDGGMSDVDVFKTMYQFVDQGGSLDFLWPALGKLDIDFDVEFGGLSNFCTTFPDFPLCTDGGKLPDICEKDTEGKKPWYCNVDVDVDLPNVDVDLTGVDVDLTIKCPEGFKDEDGTCVPINITCPEGFKDEDGQCIPITIGCPEGFKDEDGTCVPINVNCPEGFKYSESQKQCIKIVCPEGFKNEEGECVPINCPSGFRYDDSRGECIQIPILNCKDLDFPIPNSVKGQTHSKQINEDGTEECVPDIVECIEGFDFDGQTCVEIKGPDIGCKDKQIPNGVQKFKKNSLGECIPDVVECIEGFDFDGQQCVKIDIKKPCLPPGSGKVRNETTNECECPPGQEENALGYCVDPVDKCPAGQQRNAEGVCEDIEGPDGPDGPDIKLPPFEMPDINIPQFEQPQTMQPTQITADPRLLTRSQFPITDYLSQAIKGGGMLTGNGNKIV
jgi:hypothetical protein